MPHVPEFEKLFKFGLEIVTACLPLQQSSPRVPCCSIVTVLQQCTFRVFCVPRCCQAFGAFSV